MLFLDFIVQIEFSLYFGVKKLSFSPIRIVWFFHVANMCINRIDSLLNY